VHTYLRKVLSIDEVARVNDIVASEAPIDGRTTSVVTGKRNLQLPLESPASQQAGTIVTGRLLAHEEFNLAVLPAALHMPLFSRYDPGMEYPDHIDVGIMGRIRTDVAVTVFLSEPASYSGGELVVDTGIGTRRYRLAAGDAIAYPASTVHHVERVTQGVRLVAVLWVQSLVRDPSQREILHGIGQTMRACEHAIFSDRLRRSYWNLMRMWADTSVSQ
jgi:PKHD-type hydroxylase